LAEKRTHSIAIVGSETLLGKEIREVLGATPLGEDLRLVAAEDEQAGAMAEIQGEPTVLAKLTPGALEGATAIILAGSAETTEDVVELRPDAPLIDVTYAAEENPAARLRAPMVEAPETKPPKDAIHVIAHPAAIAIAMILGRIHVVFPIKRAVIQVFEPASERGTPGIEELQQQTVSLLSFKTMPKTVFDEQLAFTLLACWGSDATATLEDVEMRVERHLASLLAGSSHAPMPSLRLIQAPVFHGYSASLWIELDDNPGIAAIEQTLADVHVDVRGREAEAPNNVSVAGQNEIAVGAIRADRNQPNALWMWMAVDNLRLTAQNAAMVVKDLV
jgi:aspartate-semialdehyde dehydrogenase